MHERCHFRRLGLLGLSFLALLGLLSAGTEISRARAQGPQPADVLKKQGINRARGSPGIWVLEDEAVLARKYQYARRLLAQLEAARGVMRELDIGRHDPAALIEFCRTQMSLLDLQLSAMDDSALPATSRPWRDGWSGPGSSQRRRRFRGCGRGRDGERDEWQAATPRHRTGMSPANRRRSSRVSWDKSDGSDGSVRSPVFAAAAETQAVPHPGHYSRSALNPTGSSVKIASTPSAAS
jgi:hypothetical protein